MLNWQLKLFNELTPLELYDILQLRQIVLVVEQNCPYLDADGYDNLAHHLMGRDDKGKLIASVRILPADTKYAEPSIGRVVSHPDERRKGYGKELMRESIRQLEMLYGRVDIRIGAQKYLQRYYESFGFEDCQEDYIEDGIPHLLMLRKAK